MGQSLVWVWRIFSALHLGIPVAKWMKILIFQVYMIVIYQCYSPCLLYLKTNGYFYHWYTGRQIVCNTSGSTVAGEVNIKLRIRRGHASMMADPNTSPTFLYAVPTIDSVSPLFGPSAGGTLVRIRGSSLNISDTNETRVRLAGLECPILYVYTSSCA